MALVWLFPWIQEKAFLVTEDTSLELGFNAIHLREEFSIGRLPGCLEMDWIKQDPMWRARKHQMSLTLQLALQITFHRDAALNDSFCLLGYLMFVSHQLPCEALSPLVLILAIDLGSATPSVWRWEKRGWERQRCPRCHHQQLCNALHHWVAVALLPLHPRPPWLTLSFRSHKGAVIVHSLN